MADVSRRILVIDDEAKFTALVKTLLEQLGRYEVRVEQRGRSGLETAKRFRPDLILLDVLMPDMDGGEVAAQLKADPELKRIPVVFITAAVRPEEASAGGGQIAGYPFIAKPLNLTQLKECVAKALER